MLGGPLLAILVLARPACSRVAAAIAQFEAQQAVFVTSALLFDLLEQQPFTAPILRRLQAEWGAQAAAWLLLSKPCRQWLRGGRVVR